MDNNRVSVIIPGRCEKYFQPTIDSILENATGDIEVIAVIDGYVPNPSIVAKDNRVKLLHLHKSVGQREGYNIGVRESTGKYVMKLDAHALVCNGFDEILKSHCPPKTTVLPVMRRLDVDKWEAKNRGKTYFMYFGLDVFCHYWQDYRKREESREEYPEVLTGQGSCWFTTREWNDYIGLLDASLGSWGKVGIEISLKTWLCGGKQIVNKQAWQAHHFRAGQGRFPYPIDGRQLGKTKDITFTKFYFSTTEAFPKQIRPFSWLMNKFKPIPGWEAYHSDQFKAPRYIIYYTNNKIDESLARSVRKRLQISAGPIPIISVSKKPINFGKNICIGNISESMNSIYKQILVGAKETPPNSILYLCEHDVFYHPSHFAILPKTNKAFFFNQNRYYLRVGMNSFYPALKRTRALSQAIVNREYLISKFDLINNGIDPLGDKKIRWFESESDRPNVDIRHDDNFTKDGTIKLRYQRGQTKGINNLGGWGGVSHFRSIVSYKGVMRYDIIQYLIDLYSYKSYLEIGASKKDCWKFIQCQKKIGVDPAGKCDYPITSDKYFSNNQDKFDLIFIDGLHEAKQVKRDIYNALNHLNIGGTIVMHDCNPISKEEQQVPKNQKQRIWVGDCWKAYMKYRTRLDLEMYVIDTNNGVGIIRSGKQKIIKLNENINYQDFSNNKKKYLNLKTTKWFKEYENKRQCTLKA